MNTKRKAKDCTITIRCTNDEKQKIMKNAMKENISISEYALEAAMTGRQNYKSKEKKIMCRLVKLQQEINEIHEEIQNRENLFSKEEVFYIVNKIEKGVFDLWEK